MRASRKAVPLGDLLVERGWLTADDKAHVEHLVESRLLGLVEPDAASSLTLDVSDSHRRYATTRLYATGGIGRVWVARDNHLGRDVALKDLKPEHVNSPAAQARFLREAQITGQLEHPGIVPVYELARHTSDGHPFYTMRLVRGRTLSEATRAHHVKRQAGAPSHSN